PNGTSDSMPLHDLGAESGHTDSTDDGEHDYRTSLDDPLATPAHKPPTLGKDTTPQLQLSNHVSSKGVGVGYAAAVSIQILSIGILILFSKASPSISKSTLPLRVILFFVGLCWAAGSIPTAYWLRRRPGPPLPAAISKRGRFMTWISYLGFAWKSLWRTIKVAVQLRQAVVFLLAWFLLSDAIATVSGTAILFAKTELNMPTPAVAGVSVIATLSGIAGAFSWPIISRRFGLRSNQTILCCIMLFEIIPLYGLLGFIPIVRRWGVGGLQQSWEIFPLAFVHGFVMGGLSSFCRSFFGVLIPPGSEAAFYALYAVTDKGSSVIGPAIVGKILDSTGEIRSAFWFLAVLILLPAPMVWYVDAEKGREGAVKMADRMRKDSDDVSARRGSLEEAEEEERLMSGNDR
ncbi:hypothetical protein LTS18_007182, partial [Coniosporium uncinatum]